MRAFVGLAVAALAGGCIPSEGPMMNPGRDCLECHSAGGEAELAWTAAGTVYNRPGDPPGEGVSDVRVHLVDASGRAITLNTNEAGNFYTREPLQFPLLTFIEKDGITRAMPEPVTDGACNRCHTVPPPEAKPTGRIALIGGGSGDPLMNPGQNCQVCHNGADAQRWSASGTVYLTADAAAEQGIEGVTIRIVGATGIVTTLVSNAAGNFYAPDPIAFPARVEIEGNGVVRAMEPALEHGSCNACHGPGGEEGRVALTGGGD
jgi:hypothetical protein